jgi:patatin-like phospholipase/acyl hydrolase
VKVLSIDAGGIRGLIPALVLAEIERRTGRRTAELFDLIAGTSTGAVLACGLTRPGPDGKPLHSADELADLYRTEGPKIFDRSLRIDERYHDSGLDAALAASLGDARLKDAVTDVLLTAYDDKDRFAFFFRSSRARIDDAYDFSMATAARAAAAAPSSFAPVEVTDAAGARSYWLRDGGAFASNPAMCAYAEVVGAAADVSVIAALGTGAHTGAPEHDPVGFQAATLSRGRYRRLQAELRYASDAIDNAGEANLRRLQGDAERLIAERSQDIEALCEEVAG